MKVEAEGERAVVHLRHTRKMREQLASIISLLPEVQAQHFNPDLMLDGYSSFLKFRTKEIATMLDGEMTGNIRDDVKDEETYEAWYKEFHAKSESHTEFSRLLQNLQIRTSSEAMAETVGSILGNHVGKGRYLDESQLSKEVVLEFNLGPLHLLHDLALKIYELRPQEFIYRKDTSGSLATRITRLRNHEEGAAVDTFRKMGERRAHLPSKLWS